MSRAFAPRTGRSCRAQPCGQACRPRRYRRLERPSHSAKASPPSGWPRGTHRLTKPGSHRRPDAQPAYNSRGPARSRAAL